MRNHKGQFTKGHKPYHSASPKGTHNSPKSEFKKGLVPWNKGKKFPQISGDKHWYWQGGITGMSHKYRCSLEYKLWRKAVLERDKYACIWCGSTEKLEIDHIKPFSLYPELRFAIDNGRTLCQNCHRKTGLQKLIYQHNKQKHE